MKRLEKTLVISTLVILTSVILTLVILTLVILTDALEEIRATQLQNVIPELSCYSKSLHEFGKAVICV